MSVHPVTLSSTGNTTGPRTHYVCLACNTRKPETEFRVYPTGRRGKHCRKCRAEQIRAWKRDTGYTKPPKNDRPRRTRSRPEIRMPDDHLEIDVPTCRRILAAVLAQAIEQMREPRPKPKPKTQAVYSRDAVRQWCRTRAEAVIWLGSRRATHYFDALDIDQEAALSRLQWPAYARAVLEDGYGTDEPLSRERRRVLKDGIEYLTGERPCSRQAS